MKSKLIIIFPVILILLASLACGQGTAPVSQSPTQQSQAQPSVQPPLATNTLMPTMTPEPTGPCANIFYPFVPGYQWIYQADDGDDTTEDTTRVGLTVSSVDGSQAQIDALDLSSGVITHTTVDCSDGAILNYPMLTLGTLFGDMLTGQLNITYVDGLFMPAESQLAAANWVTTWSGNYKASGTFAVAEEGESSTLTLNDSPVLMEWSLIGQEPVTVEAGTFEDAYKVTRKTTLDVSLEVEGLSVKAILIVNTNQWYAANIGLLKNQVDTASLGYMGISFPVEMKGRLELVEFRPGP